MQCVHTDWEMVHKCSSTWRKCPSVGAGWSWFCRGGMPTLLHEGEEKICPPIDALLLWRHGVCNASVSAGCKVHTQRNWIISGMVTVPFAPLTSIGTVLVSNLNWDANHHSWDRSGFLQYLHAHSRIMPGLSQGRFLPNNFLNHHSPITHSSPIQSSYEYK